MGNEHMTEADKVECQQKCKYSSTSTRCYNTCVDLTGKNRRAYSMWTQYNPDILETFYNVKETWTNDDKKGCEKKCKGKITRSGRKNCISKCLKDADLDHAYEKIKDCRRKYGEVIKSVNREKKQDKKCRQSCPNQCYRDCKKAQRQKKKLRQQKRQEKGQKMMEKSMNKLGLGLNLYHDDKVQDGDPESFTITGIKSAAIHVNSVWVKGNLLGPA